MTEVSQEYAVALFSLSRESGTEFGTDLATVRQVLTDTPAYLDMLASPAIPMPERLDAIRAALGDAVCEPVCSFVQLLCRNDEIRLFFACADAYDAMLAAENRRSVARVISAVPLTDAEQTTLREKLEKRTGHTVTLECEVDASLLGGAVVYVDGKVLDGSVRHRLQDLKEVVDR